MNEKRYNGWANYETWAVNLWWSNDQGSCNFWTERARAAWDEAGRERPHYFSQQEAATYALADEMKAQLECDAPDDHEVEGIFLDLLDASISEVSFSEIARAWLDGAVPEFSAEGAKQP